MPVIASVHIFHVLVWHRSETVSKTCFLLLPFPHNYSLDMQDGSTSLPLYGFDVVAPWLCTAVHFACLAPLKRLLRHWCQGA